MNSNLIPDHEKGAATKGGKGNCTNRGRVANFCAQAKGVEAERRQEKERYWKKKGERNGDADSKSLSF